MMEQGTSENSSIQVETVIVVTTTSTNTEEEEEDEDDGESDRVLDQAKKKISVVEKEEERKVNVVETHSNKDDVCVIDNLDSEKVCRICHLSSDHRPSETILVLDLIQLGCGCKEELGIAHQLCAEAWFKLKGDRCCEICGEAAKNVTGVGDDRFMEEWNERRLGDTNIIPSSERRPGFWQGQTFCNFLMACLVVAFVLPWFFRVNTL